MKQESLTSSPEELSANFAQVPLIELLRSVPPKARLLIDTPNPLGVDTHSIPVGRLCHEAAAALATPLTGYGTPTYGELRTNVSAAPSGPPVAEMRPPVAWRFRFHTDDSLAGKPNVRPWVLIDKEPQSHEDIEVEPLFASSEPLVEAPSDLAGVEERCTNYHCAGDCDDPKCAVKGSDGVSAPSAEAQQGGNSDGN
jgi:hypothetical protein